MSFSGDMAKILDKAGRELQLLARTTRASIRGEVATLDRRDRVKVTGFLTEVVMGSRPRPSFDPIRRSLWVRVSSEDYDRAYAAQARGAEVEVVGRIRKTDRRLELEPDADGLRVL